MKTITLVAVFSVLVAVALASSPRKCPEECYPCEAVNCGCGSFKDECRCCDVCYKCRDEACHMLVGDACETGYTCGDPSRSYIEMVNNPATCVPEQQ